MSFSYINLSRRLQYAMQAYSQTQFFYGYDRAVLRHRLRLHRSRSGDQRRRAPRGGTITGIYPLNRYTRLEMTGGFLQFEQEYNDPTLQDIADEYQTGHLRARAVRRRPVHAARHQPRARDDDLPRVRAARRAHDVAGLRVRAELGKPAVAPDRRRSTRATTCGSAPTACSRCARRGYKSWGEYPGYLYFGGNSEMRGYDYLAFLGNKGFFTNAELRFPIIEAALTPIGVVGGLRGVFFFNFGAAGYEGVADEGVDRQDDDRNAAHRLRLRSDVAEPVRAGVRPAAAGVGLPTDRQPRVVRRRARDLRARLPDPLRLVVADAVQQGLGGRGLLLPGARRRRVGPNAGSTWFRKVKFSVWIGYDF